MTTPHFASVIVRVEANNLKDSRVLPVRFECSSVSTMPRHTPVEALVAGLDEIARLLAIEGLPADDVVVVIDKAYRRVRQWRREQQGLR